MNIFSIYLFINLNKFQFQIEMEKVKDNKYDFIDFGKIKRLFTISDNNLFPIYLKEVYKDLIERTESNKTNGVSKVTFYEYIKLPIFISDKLFNAFDKDNNGFLSVKEFVEGFNTLYYGNFKQTAKVIFNMFDFDRDGQVNKDDIKVLFSYLPLKSEDRQLESLKEIDTILSKVKFENNGFNFSKFLENILSVSDIYLQMICYLIDKKPFAIENVEACRNLPKYLESIKNLEENSPNKNTPEHLLSKDDIAFRSPPKTTCFKPLDNIINLMDVEDFSLADDDDEIIKKENQIQLLEKRGDKDKNIVIDKSVFKDQSEMVRMSNQRQFQTGEFQTPSKFLLQKTSMDMEDLDIGNNQDSNNSIPKNERKLSCTGNLVKKSSQNLITKSGAIFKVTENRNLKNYFLVLCNKDIYYYKNELCNELLGMHNLSGCFVGDANPNPEKLENFSKNMFSFSLVFSNKSRVYYCHEFEEARDWVQTIKAAIGYQSFTDNYEIKDRLEGGKFGEVFLGVHKKTGEYVAIKTIKKDSMTAKDIELVKTEIDIMKMCKHQNIVRLLDHFENNQYTFIIMEYLSGGTLANYLEHTPVDDLTEKDTAKIALQIGRALEYLHQFGIVHRDLKPENIMLKGKLPHESLECLKLMDFGLSKILGPNEKVNDGFGTLTYVAPEVLTRKPYNNQVDIWSLGVIVYYTLSGSFPFDDQTNDEEVIAKKIVFQDLQFQHKSWPSRTSAVKDFIIKSMAKDLDKRIKIKELMKHKWFAESGLV